MWEYVKMVGGLCIVVLLAAHFVLAALFVTPADRLLGMMLEAEGGWVTSEELPGDVERFLWQNQVPVEGDYVPDDTFKAKLIYGILQLREVYFMDSREALVMNMNLLDYRQGGVGMEGAAFYYFGQPLDQLSDKHWITLVHLHNIFLK